MRLNLDRQGKFRYQVLSMLVDGEGQVRLESSFASQGQAENMFERQYSKWGFTDTNFYLVDWQEQKLLAKHEVFNNEYTQILGSNPR